MFSKECKVVNMDTWDRMIPKKDLHHVPAIGEIVSVRITDILPDGKLNLSFFMTIIM